MKHEVPQWCKCILSLKLHFWRSAMSEISFRACLKANPLKLQLSGKIAVVCSRSLAAFCLFPYDLASKSIPLRYRLGEAIMCFGFRASLLWQFGQRCQYYRSETVRHPCRRLQASCQISVSRYFSSLLSRARTSLWQISVSV